MLKAYVKAKMGLQFTGLWTIFSYSTYIRSTIEQLLGNIQVCTD